MYGRDDFQGLVREYVADVVIIKGAAKRNTSSEEKDSSRVRKVCYLLSMLQCSRARKHVTSNRLGDINNKNIVQQMKRKHSSRKKEITPITESEASSASKGINKKTLREVLTGLKHDTSQGLGRERKEHLIILRFYQHREVSSRAASAFDNMFELPITT